MSVYGRGDEHHPSRMRRFHHNNKYSQISIYIHSDLLYPMNGKRHIFSRIVISPGRNLMRCQITQKIHIATSWTRKAPQKWRACSNRIAMRTRIWEEYSLDYPPSI